MGFGEWVLADDPNQLQCFLLRIKNNVFNSLWLGDAT